MAVGRQNRLAEPRGPDGGERANSVAMQDGAKATGVVARDEFHAELLEGVARGVETEAFVVAAHGKIKEGVIPRTIEQRKRALREESVHHADAQIEIVEEGAVPIPDDVAIR